LQKVATTSFNQLESMIISLALNVFVISFIQISEIYATKHFLYPLFYLELEVSLLLFLFQIGACMKMREGMSLEDYFEEFGGLLVVFGILCLILCSLGSVLSGGEYQINLSELIIKN